MHTPATLFAELDALGITHHTYTHAPLHTVADGAGITDQWPPGAHIKNLLLKDKAGALTLVTVLQSRRMDLVRLGKHLGSKDRLSFAKEDVMEQTLGVRPGAVTPLALANAAPGSLTFVLDDAIFNAPLVYAHPLINTQTTALAPDDLLRAIAHWQHTPMRLNLGDFEKSA